MVITVIKIIACISEQLNAAIAEDNKLIAPMTILSIMFSFDTMSLMDCLNTFDILVVSFYYKDTKEYAMTCNLLS